MRFTFASAALSLATVASATVFQVQVGQNGLAFTPSTVNASAGDQVQFIFNPSNHSATQSTFANPCRPMANGSDSGFMPANGANADQAPNVTVLINSTDPVWFFCRQTGYASIPVFGFPFRRFCLLCLPPTCSHCLQGMVFAVNPTANMTFDAFQAAARASNSGSGPSTSGSSGSGSPAASSPSSTSSPSGNGKSGAITVGLRTGSLLAVVGFVAGLLL
jgi:plastocyanin